MASAPLTLNGSGYTALCFHSMPPHMALPTKSATAKVCPLEFLPRWTISPLASLEWLGASRWCGHGTPFKCTTIY